MQRVSVYVDGFNLYYGLKSKGWRRYYWLDLRRLAESILQSGQQLMTVRYFTARVMRLTDDPEQSERQQTYLEVLETLTDLYIHYGYFLPKRVFCQQCGAIRETYEEKMTDVNIAVELMGDAQDDAFDTAIVISGDSDLAGPVEAIRRRYPEKRVIAAFPPNRVSLRLSQAVTASFVIGRRRISTSLLPDRVVKSDGYVLAKPPQWS